MNSSNTPSRTTPSAANRACTRSRADVDDLTQHDRKAEVSDDPGVRAQQLPQTPLRGQHVLGAGGELVDDLFQLHPGHIREPEIRTR